VPLIYPFDTSIQNINLDRRSRKIELGSLFWCVHIGTFGRSMSSTNSLLLPRRGVFTPFIIRWYRSSFSPSVAHCLRLDLRGRASEIRLRLISPGGKKTVYSPRRIHVHKGASHSSWTTHAVGHLWKEREKKKRRRRIWSWEWQIRFQIFSIAVTSGK